MRTFDPSPLMRASIGFDRMMKLLDAQTQLDEGATSYPPYNIEKLGEDDYRIVMAVAGFGEDELDVTVKETSLVIAGKKEKTEEKLNYLHRGIATRGFERRFDLADHIKVIGAKLENGLLYIELVREVPEAKKPKTITIERVVPSRAKVIEGAAA